MVEIMGLFAADGRHHERLLRGDRLALGQAAAGAVAKRVAELRAGCAGVVVRPCPAVAHGSPASGRQTDRAEGASRIGRAGQRIHRRYAATAARTCALADGGSGDSLRPGKRHVPVGDAVASAYPVFFARIEWLGPSDAAAESRAIRRIAKLGREAIFVDACPGAGFAYSVAAEPRRFGLSEKRSAAARDGRSQDQESDAVPRARAHAAKSLAGRTALRPKAPTSSLHFSGGSTVSLVSHRLGDRVPMGNVSRWISDINNYAVTLRRCR
jgi:hypothetical protein